jgi:hypothetical protein
MPALLSDTDASMAMAVPMNWSVAEPAIGILVSSGPAIRAVRLLFRKAGEDSYGSNGPKSASRSRNGHIQLHDINGEVKDEENQKKGNGDNESEEYLVEENPVMDRHTMISKTTQVEVSYSQK